MATTTSLRSRRSAAQLHALASVEREIRAQDHNGRRKYLRDFTQAYRSYESVLDRQQLNSLVHSADILLVGDYHALPASQRFAAALLEERAQSGDRPVILGVETIFLAISTFSTNGGAAKLVKQNSVSAFDLMSIGATIGSHFTNCC